MTERRDTIYISIRTAGQQTGLSRQTVQKCVERRLVREPLSADDLAELRRIRRLRELGVNLQGIEIILHMRRRIQALQVDLDRWERLWGRRGWSELQGPWQRLLPWEPDDD
jgi:DNA-binding transcriptional MerR regulator